MSEPQNRVQVLNVLTGEEYDREMSSEEILALLETPVADAPPLDDLVEGEQP